MVKMGQQTLQAPRFIGGCTLVTGDLTMTAGDIMLGANLIKTTNLALKQDTSSALSVRNVADSAYRDLRIRDARINQSVVWEVDGLLQTKSTAAGYVDLQSHSGSAYVSCIKLVGGKAEIAAGKLTGSLNCNSKDLLSVSRVIALSYLEMIEVSKPSNPAANKVRIYPKLKDGGFTALYALFQDGTEVEFASES